jgi:hypothetical protein
METKILREARSLTRRVEDGEPMLPPDRRDREMHKRLPMPGSIPTGDAYNILLHVEHGPRDEMDRVLQIAREGLAAARKLRSDLHVLTEMVPDEARLLVEHVCDHVAARNIFGSSFREAAERLRLDVQHWSLPAEEREKILDQLERALHASETVADASAAAMALKGGTSIPTTR